MNKQTNRKNNTEIIRFLTHPVILAAILQMPWIYVRPCFGILSLIASDPDNMILEMDVLPALPSALMVTLFFVSIYVISRKIIIPGVFLWSSKIICILALTLSAHAIAYGTECFLEPFEAWIPWDLGHPSRIGMLAIPFEIAILSVLATFFAIWNRIRRLYLLNPEPYGFDPEAIENSFRRAFIIIGFFPFITLSWIIPVF